MNSSSYDTLSIKALREKLQATAPEAGRETFVGQTVRFFSIYFTKFFARTNFTPNQLTSLSVFVFLVGTWFFYWNEYTTNLIGVFLIYFSIILDACDGEIARLKGNKSGVGGTYTEPVSHDIQYALTFIPISLGIYQATGDVVIIYVAFIGTIAKLLFRFLQIRFWYVTNRGSTGPTPEFEETRELKAPARVSLPHRVYKFFNRNVFSSVGQVIPLLLFVLLNRLDLFIWFFTLGYSSIFLANFLRQVVFISRLSK